MAAGQGRGGGLPARLQQVGPRAVRQGTLLNQLRMLIDAGADVNARGGDSTKIFLVNGMHFKISSLCAEGGAVMTTASGLAVLKRSVRLLTGFLKIR